VLFSSYPAYRPHEVLVAPARAKAQVWRLFMGMILIAGVFLISNQFLHQTMFTLLGAEGYRNIIDVSGDSSQASIVVLLLTFGFITLGVLVALRVAHARGITDVFGPWVVFRSQFWSVLSILVLLNVVVLVLPPWDIGGPLVLNNPPGRWMLALPFALTAIMVQVSAEEILFRGYLQQQLAARFRAPVIWIGLPALLFGVGHYMPAEAGDNANLIVVWAVVFGILMADLTARAGTLGPAIAVHFVNNFIAIAIISMPGSLSGLSLYFTPFTMQDTAQVRAWLPVDFAMMIVSWLAARLAIRR
jgi:membrane protease YdiL (CAAX protease family)